VGNKLGSKMYLYNLFTQNSNKNLGEFKARVENFMIRFFKNIAEKVIMSIMRSTLSIKLLMTRPTELRFVIGFYHNDKLIRFDQIPRAINGKFRVPSNPYKGRISNPSNTSTHSKFFESLFNYF
jgi:hypothetical protein